MINISERIVNPKTKKVFRLVQKLGPVSKQNLQEKCDLPVSTLTRILEELVQEGWLRTVGYGKSSGGRRPFLYEMKATRAFMFGLDISRIDSRLILCDLKLNVLDSVTWSMTSDMTAERLIELISMEVPLLLKVHHIASQDVLGIGIGAVGPLNRTQGVILDPQYFQASGWNHVSISSLLQDQLSIPVVLDNGVNAALLGEYWSRFMDRYAHLLYVHAGVGIRSSSISNGTIRYGAVDSEGAVGQMIIQSDGVPPRQAGGNFGAWESYASTYALEQRTAAVLKQGRVSSLRERLNEKGQISFQDIVEAVKEKDSLAVELITQTAVFLGIGLSNLINILQPELVILGGPLVNCHPSFFEHAVNTAKEKTFVLDKHELRFSNSTLGDNAVAIGAAVTILNKVTEA